jgi:hypothetical protein
LRKSDPVRGSGHMTGEKEERLLGGYRFFVVLPDVAENRFEICRRRKSGGIAHPIAAAWRETDALTLAATLNAAAMAEEAGKPALAVAS